MRREQVFGGEGAAHPPLAQDVEQVLFLLLVGRVGGGCIPSLTPPDARGSRAET
jgi:hypothetical protein